MELSYWVCLSLTLAGYATLFSKGVTPVSFAAGSVRFHTALYQNSDSQWVVCAHMGFPKILSGGSGGQNYCHNNSNEFPVFATLLIFTLMVQY